MKYCFKALLIICVALVVWGIVNISFIGIVVEFALKRNDLIYLYLYYLLMHLLIGFGIGWYSKSKGWLLGLVFGVIVITISWLLPLTSDTFKPTLSSIGLLGALRRAILSIPAVIVVVCSTIGGLLGSRLRAIRKDKWGQPLTSDKIER